MEKIEYRVKPVTRYVVTCHKQSANSGSCGPVGEFQNSKSALQIAEALAEKDGGTVVPSPEHESAIVQLMISAENCETNAPIWAAKGNLEQSECSRRNAASYRAAIAALAGEDEQLTKLALSRIQPADQFPASGYADHLKAQAGSFKDK